MLFSFVSLYFAIPRVAIRSLATYFNLTFRDETGVHQLGTDFNFSSCGDLLSISIWPRFDRIQQSGLVLLVLAFESSCAGD